MGAERFCEKQHEEEVVVEAPFIVGLQPSALVDNVAHVDSSFLARIPGQRSGSIPVAIEELQCILREVKSHDAAHSHPHSHSSMKTMAGGSVANTIRGLSRGFGISSGIIGACGDDEQGHLFVNNMSFNGVDLSILHKKNGHTAQAKELVREDFKGSKWLVLRYAILNLDIIQEAIALAKQEGLLVSLDLASFEMVRNFKQPLLRLLESGNINLGFANEDESGATIMLIQLLQ